jgi:hypothetical protein
MKHTYNPTRGVIAGLVARSCLTLLLLTGLAGCSDLVKPDLVNPEAGTSLGTGRLTIALTGTGTGERTLFPSAPESFSKYELAFTPKSGQKAMDPVMFTEGTSHSLTLPVGDWTITALAYIRIQDIAGITDGDYVAARGTKDVTVSTADMYETIDLRGGVDEEGKGVFSYDITLPEDLGSASLEMLDLEGKPVKWVDLKLTASGSFALDSGYYLLKISRAKGGDAEVRAEVVHIYTALTTEAVGPGYDFTGFSGITEVVLGFLSAQPANTAGSPYTVALRALDMETDLGKGSDPLGLLFEVLAGKYVNLDLSACVGGHIQSVAYDTANSRPNRDKIVSLTLPDTVTGIGEYAFRGCTSLASIDLPDSLITMGSGAFYGTSLVSVDLPDSVTSVDLSGCALLTSIDLPDSLTSIGYEAFYGCTSLASIDLPDSLTTIGEWAFSDCTSLAAIDLPDSLTAIGAYAFSGCTSLASIDLPDSLTAIKYMAFSDCTSLASIDLPDSITAIGGRAFWGCTSLASIDLPDSLTAIEYGAFEGCTSLAAIDLPDTLITIGGATFYGCTKLASIDLPDTLSSIGSYAFYGCTSLASIDLPDGLTSIEYMAFFYCTSLASIDLPDSLTSIGERAFSYCTSLASIDLPDSLTSIDEWAFSDCTSLAAIDLPDSLTSIGEWAFSYCTSLASIDLPDSLTSIGNYAFSWCTSLASIDLPDTLTEIGGQAFDGCTSLKIVLSRNTTPPVLGSYAFYNTPSSLLIYVPDTSVDAYKSAWGYSSSIKPLSELP